MAKPGSDAARELAGMARRAADLGGGDVPEALVPQLAVKAEGQLGMRCSGCGERIGVGLKFTRIDYVMSEGKPTVDVSYLAACNGADGCNFANEARAGADVMEMIEFVWLHGDPPVGHGLSDEEQIAKAQSAVDGVASPSAPDPVAEGEEFPAAVNGHG